MLNKKIIPLHLKNFKFVKLKGPFDKKVDLKILKKLLNDNKIEFLKKDVKKYNLKFRELNKQERDQQILNHLKFLNNEIFHAGPKRKKIWEAGWGENYRKFNSSNKFNDLIPNYYKRGLKVMRFNGDYILAGNNLFEQNLGLIILKYISIKYLKDISSIYEFGCGPSNNIFALAKILKNKVNFCGIDWANASMKILKILQNKKKKLGFDRHNFESKKINLFNKIKDFNVPPNSLCLTWGGIEQIGKNNKNFLNFIFKKKFNLYIHIETVYENYDPEILFDYLGMEYEKKRHYLKGFYPRLLKLEKDKKIKIIKVKKIIGSHFNDGWTLFIWKRI
jgi:hypothetical protein